MKKLSMFIMLFLILSIIPAFSINNTAFARDAGSSEKAKVIMLIMDYVDTADILTADTPNLDKLINQSGTGLMNVRARNRNPSSAYMSLSAAARVGTISNAKIAYNSDEIVQKLPAVFELENSTLQSGELYSLFTGKEYPQNGVVNIYSEKLKQTAANYNPVYQIGQIGTSARELGLTISVLGNADTMYSIDRNIALLAMDENGIVPLGNVSKEVVENKPTSLGGLRTNHNKLLQMFEDLLETSDIMVIDTGDTSRVESSRTNCAEDVLIQHRKNAVERADLLLGKLLSKLNMNNTMLIILTPNPNKDMLIEGNLGLTPVIIYNPSSNQGLLTSSTTRRTGLVSNYDLLPTIFNYFGYQVNTASTGISTVKSTDNSFKVLNQDLELFKNLRTTRNPLHYIFMFLAVLAILGGYLAYIRKHIYLIKAVNLVIYTTLIIPVVFLFISLTRYSTITGPIIITLLVSFLISLLLLVLLKEPVDVILLISGITMILLTFDSFTGSRLMLLSPLGSDAIAGGRFYGIGNDYMGVLIASTVIFGTLFFGKLNIKPVFKVLGGIIPMLIITTAIGHPHFGANVGGLITALVTTGVFLLITLEKRLSLKLVFIIGIMAMTGVLIVAQLDALYSSAPSHAGKAINMLFSGGFSVFLSIIRTKLGILAGTIYHSSWSIILLLSLTILTISRFTARSSFLRIAVEQPLFYKIARILLITGLTVFVVNDTGVIAAALIILYVICCLWIAMYYSEYQYQGRELK